MIIAGHNMKWILKDIRFWIVLFFTVRLYGITNPPIEVGHNWRMTVVNMVARNFSEIDNTIYYPRLDIAGDKTGITGMEFPIFNYLIYLVSEIFGYQHWYGRLINLIITSFGMLYFFKLIQRFFNSEVAFNSTIILTVSLWFQFSRKIMPDTFSASLVIAGLYYGFNYIYNEHKKRHLVNLLLFSALITLGMLSKLSSACLLAVIGLVVVQKDISITKKTTLSLIVLICLIPVVFWYFYWVPKLVETYEFWHFYMGKEFTKGLSEIYNNVPAFLLRFYDSALKYIGFVVFCIGFVGGFITKNKKILSISIITFLAFSVFIIKAGLNFSHHNYYVLPFIPVMALVAGYGITLIKNKKLGIVLLAIISIEGIANQQHEFRNSKSNEYLIGLESDLDKISAKEDLILINCGQFPTPMYFAHRKGWIDENRNILQEGYIDSLNGKGLKYAVILKGTFGDEIDLKPYEKRIDNMDYSIYEL